MSAFDVYKAVTDRILELLDSGTVPWRNPIRTAEQGWPANVESRRAYRGINVFLLAVTTWCKGYGSPYWLTFRQAVAKGGHIRKGEKASMVVFWKQHQTTDQQTGEPKQVPVLRYYHVFNLDQCKGVKAPEESTDVRPPFQPLKEADRIIAGYSPHAGGGPAIEHGGHQAIYIPPTDTVLVPAPDAFGTHESYYATAFHELAHSTGHSKRLDRGLDKRLQPFGSQDYSREELVAEMGAAFLCASAGISPPTIEQSAAYIDGWKKRLKADRKVVVMAAGAGQRACDWILGVRNDAAPTQSPDDYTV